MMLSLPFAFSSITTWTTQNLSKPSVIADSLGWFPELHFSISVKLGLCQRAARAQKHHEKINL